jgi:acyl-homoserine-lactone acylase
MRISGFYPVLLLLTACVAAAQQPSAEQMAQQVTIYRDHWGTPHVFGKTDASTIFGFAYAQAEDNFTQMEDDFVFATGRGAEIYGPDLTKEDLLNRTLEIEGHAKDDYTSIDPHMRALCDAFAAGVNFYLARHPDVHPRLLTRIEPWYPLAFIRYNYYQNGFARDPKLGEEPSQTAALRTYHADNGSNGWVVAPSRSASGYPLLFIDPHLPYYGPGQVYEGHIHSDEGWDFTGYARFGFPFPYIGHNANLGWMSTDNFADMVDGYVEHFDDSVHPLSYRYGKEHKTAIAKTVTIKIKKGDSMVTREFQTLWTIHGPILTKQNGMPIAARLPMYESHGWMREWYDMTKARNLKELISAVAPHAMLFGNIMSAGTDGHIFYVYNAAIPIRDPKFDWTKPVDGSDPATEWKGYYPVSALPQLTDPKTGWMQNCNTSPFVLTTDGNPDPKNYPPYMVREGIYAGSDPQNPRGRASERILSAHAKFTLEEWAQVVFDTRVSTADDLLPKWLPLMKKDASTGDLQPLGQAVALLESWDHVSRVDAVAMTIFTRWHSAMRNRIETTENLTAALQEVLSDLIKTFGDWRVPYGELNRLARSTAKGKPPFGFPLFDDDEPSLSLPAVNGNDGAVFTLYTTPGKQNRRRYGVAGDTYVSVIEFGPQPRALSVMTYGESGDPKSPHFNDQAALFVKGQFKPSWFTLDEVKKNAEAAYRPGD